MFYSLGALFTELIQIKLGHTGNLDWRLLLTVFPIVSVCLVTGFLDGKLKCLLIYSILAGLINNIYSGLKMCFNEKYYQLILREFDNSPFIFLSLSFISIVIISFVCFYLGLLLSYLHEIIFSKKYS